MYVQDLEKSHESMLSALREADRDKAHDADTEQSPPESSPVSVSPDIASAELVALKRPGFGMEPKLDDFKLLPEDGGEPGEGGAGASLPTIAEETDDDAESPPLKRLKQVWVLYPHELELSGDV